MAAEEKKAIDFVAQLPDTIDPYTATAQTAQMVGSLIKAPPMPQWSSLLTRFTLVAFLIMFFQAAFLLYQRIRTNKFGTLKFNELGLLVINLSDAMALLLGIYAILTIAFLSEEIAVQHGLIDESSLLLIFGYKFLVVLTCSWAFGWVCSCHCATLISESEFGSKMNRDKLQAALKWGVYSFFLVAVLVPFPLVLWSYGSAYQEFRTMRSIVRQVQTSISEASNYDPQTNVKIRLLELLRPARELLPHWTQMEHDILRGIKVYGLSLTLLAVLYNPLLFFSLRDLYKKPVSPVGVSAAMGPGLRWQPPRMCRKARRDRRSLVYHAFVVYCSTLVHLPIIFWQFFHSSDGFTKNPTWNAVTYHGLTCPFSVTGNIVLLILNLHSRNVLLDMQRTSMKLPWEPISGKIGKSLRKTSSDGLTSSVGAKFDCVESDGSIFEKKMGDALDKGTNSSRGARNHKSASISEILKPWNSESPLHSLDLDRKLGAIDSSQSTFIYNSIVGMKDERASIKATSYLVELKD